MRRSAPCAFERINLLFIYLEHKIKRSLALSLNWKVNFKLFKPGMCQNGSMYYKVPCKRQSSVKSGAWLRRFDDVIGVSKTDILR